MDHSGNSMSLRSRFIALFAENSFAKNVTTLASGTALAQALPLLFAPVLTRLFSPEDFGTFSLFLAVTSIFSVWVTGVYEQAIVLPGKNKKALGIMILSIALTLFFVSLLSGLLLLSQGIVLGKLGLSEIPNWCLFVPPAVIFMAVIQALTQWHNRQQRFKQVSFSRVVQSAITIFSQLGTGVLAIGAVGLIWGSIFGQIAILLMLMGYFVTRDLDSVETPSIQQIYKLGVEYVNFPKYMLLGQLSNSLSSNLQVILLGALFGPAIAGQFALSQRVLAAPLTLITGAVGEVFRVESSKVFREKGNFLNLFITLLKRLTVFALLPCFPIAIFGPMIFSTIFGEEWKIAGEMASILAIMVFFQSLSTPLAHSLLIAGQQKLDMCWQFVRLFFSISSIWVGYEFYSSYQVAVVLYAVSFSFLYVCHSFVQFLCAKGILSSSPEGKVY